jgi:hypothetical protein
LREFLFRVAMRQRAGPPALQQQREAPIADPIAPSQPQPLKYTKRPAFNYLGQFVSFGLAGAILGGGLGIAAANYLQLPAEQARLAIFGPAGFLAMLCAFASFFNGGSMPEERSK